MYGWHPVLLVSVQLLCLFLINKNTCLVESSQSNRRSNVLWEIPLTETEVCDKYLISVFLSAFAGKDSDQRWKVEGGNVWWEFLNFLFLNHSFKCDDVDVDDRSVRSRFFTRVQCLRRLQSGKGATAGIFHSGKTSFENEFNRISIL